MNPSKEQLISQRLQQWFRDNKRLLPWRDTQDPYRIWISEVILQQTRVVQGWEYYERFIEAFPTVQDLAQAPTEQVLKLWEGLGYYSRARNLHRAAQIIVEQYGGVLPSTYKDMIALPGVGAYTAGAVLSFAYHLPYPAVDGNVLRVLSRIYASDMEIDSTEGSKFFRTLAQNLIDTEHAAAHNQAIMELGALICLPLNPQCNLCPIDRFCAVAHSAMATQLPVKKGKMAVTEREFLYFFITLPCPSVETSFWLSLRKEGDIWAGLYDLPQSDSLSFLRDAERGCSIALSHLDESTLKQQLSIAGDIPISSLKLYHRCKHRLTHRLLHLSFFHLELSSFPTDFFSRYREVSFSGEIFPPMPIVIKKVVDRFISELHQR
ncbi:MAG: A/G-specific adenine glycosylase [Porphyromonas sp.]|nr:A/G-specific adenine glycosylase [Porphyromonas sp.]